MGKTWSKPINVDPKVKSWKRARIYTLAHLRHLSGAEEIPQWWNDNVLVGTGVNQTTVNTRNVGLWYSEDKGKTWSAPLDLDADTPDAGYGDMRMCKNGDLGSGLLPWNSRSGVHQTVCGWHRDPQGSLVEPKHERPIVHSPRENRTDSHHLAWQKRALENCLIFFHSPLRWPEYSAPVQSIHHRSHDSSNCWTSSGIREDTLLVSVRSVARS